MKSDPARAYDFGQDRLPGVVSNVLDLRARFGLESSQFWAILDALPVAILIADDRACSRIEANAAGRALLRAPVDQNLSQSAPAGETPPFDVFANGHRVPAEELPLQKAAATGLAIVNSECELRYTDGVSVFIAGHTVPLHDGDGQVCGSIGAFVDVSSAKQMEERNALLARELELANRRQALLLKVSDLMLRQGGDKARFIEQLFDLVAPHIGADYAFNFRMAGGDRMQLVAAPGVKEAHKAAARALRPGQAFCGTVASTRQSLYADAERIRTDPLGAFVREIGGTAYVCYPLVSSSGALMGTLSFGSRCRDAFDPDEADFLRTVCQYVSVFWEREASLNALRVTDQRFRLVTDGAHVGYWEWDIDTDHIDLASSWREALRIPPGQATDFPHFLSIVHADDRPGVDAVVRACVAGEATAPLDIQFRVTLPDGSVRWLHSKGVFDARSRKLAGISIDVTDRKRAEEQFRAAADAVPGFLFMTSAAGANVYVNDGFCDYTGLTRKELLGDGWTGIVHPQDAARVQAAWLEALRTGERYDLEYRLRRRDGAWRWHNVRAVPFAGEDEGGARWVGCCIDVHERHEGEQELRRRVERGLAEKRLWAEIVEASDIPVQVVAPDLRILAINRASVAMWSRNFGVRAHAGQSVADLLRDHPDALADYLAAWRRALDGESLTRYGQYGAEQRWWELKFSPLYAEDGSLMGALRLAYDVTERRAEQEALAARTEELRRANMQLRTEMKRREQAQAALVQAQKLEALGQLTGGIAHDFNNITQAVAGGFAVIERRASDPAIVEIARHGAAAAQRGGQLVKQLLSFARSQAMAPQSLDICAQLAETAPLLARTLGPRIELKIDCPANAPSVRVDPSLLETALVNLAANSRDVMPEGGALALSVRECPPGEAHRPPELEDRPAVAIAVRDTGPGMTPEVLRQALQPFFTTKEPGRGTGLGLAMVHGFARQSDGALRIESRLGEGTTVTLYLPRADAGTGEWDASAAVTPSGDALGPLAVLLVDDDDDVRGVTAAQLGDMGHAVTLADGVEAALAAFERGAFDIIVSDVVMRGGSGSALASAIRGRAPAFPILFITGHADRERLAGERVLEKPFTTAELARAMGATMTAAQEATDEDLALDRLARRCKAESARELLSIWRAARSAGHPPRFDAFDPDGFGEPRRLVVMEVDVAHAPMRLRMVSVGAELEDALGASLSGEDVAVAGDDEPGSLEAAYRRSATYGKPVYEYARLGFGDGAPSGFERLVTPWSTDGVTVDRLVSVVVIDGALALARDGKGMR